MTPLLERIQRLLALSESPNENEARNAALPEDVLLTPVKGFAPMQTTRQRAQELVQAGTYKLLSAPQGEEHPSDVCWVLPLRGFNVQVSRAKAIELLDAGTHKLAEQPEAGQ